MMPHFCDFIFIFWHLGTVELFAALLLNSCIALSACLTHNSSSAFKLRMQLDPVFIPSWSKLTLYKHYHSYKWPQPQTPLIVGYFFYNNSGFRSTRQYTNRCWRDTQGLWAPTTTHHHKNKKHNHNISRLT